MAGIRHRLERRASGDSSLLRKMGGKEIIVWGGGDGWQEYRLEKAVRVARTVTARRGVDLTDADESLLARIHADSDARRRVCHAPAS